MMNAPKTAQEIFWACLDVADLSQRSTRLADLCAEDDALRKHVEELLKAADIDDQFLEMPFAQSAMGPTDVPAANDDTSTESKAYLYDPQRHSNKTAIDLNDVVSGIPTDKYLSMALRINDLGDFTGILTLKGNSSVRVSVANSTS